MVTLPIRFTAQQKAELWERWKNEQSISAISRALERRNKTAALRPWWSVCKLHTHDGGQSPRLKK